MRTAIFFLLFGLLAVSVHGIIKFPRRFDRVESQKFCRGGHCSEIDETVPVAVDESAESTWIELPEKSKDEAWIELPLPEKSKADIESCTEFDEAVPIAVDEAPGSELPIVESERSYTCRTKPCRSGNTCWDICHPTTTEKPWFSFAMKPEFELTVQEEPQDEAWIGLPLPEKSKVELPIVQEESNGGIGCRPRYCRTGDCYESCKPESELPTIQEEPQDVTICHLPPPFKCI